MNTIVDLKIGMKMPGIVTNVTAFGAFVDVGVHQDGLVHISHLSDKFIKDPKEAVTVAQKVNVTVVEVDVARKRIGLSMKTNPFADQQQPAEKKSTPKGKPGGKTGSDQKRNDNYRSKPSSKPKEKELSMEEKLALLRDKFKR